MKIGQSHQIINSKIPQYRQLDNHSNNSSKLSFDGRKLGNASYDKTYFLGLFNRNKNQDKEYADIIAQANDAGFTLYQWQLNRIFLNGNKKKTDVIEIAKPILKLHNNGVRLDSLIITDLLQDKRKTSEIVPVIEAYSDFLTESDDKNGHFILNSLIRESDDLEVAEKFIKKHHALLKSGIEVSQFDIDTINTEFNTRGNFKQRRTTAQQALRVYDPFVKMAQKGVSFSNSHILSLINSPHFESKPLFSTLDTLASNIDKIEPRKRHANTMTFFDSMTIILNAMPESSPRSSKAIAIKQINKLKHEFEAKDKSKSLDDALGINLHALKMTLRGDQKPLINAISVDKSKINDFSKKFMANNADAENMLATGNFEQYKKQGLPLKYPRVEFINDLNSILIKIEPSKQDDLFNRLNIKPLYKDDSNKIISSYEGVFNINNLNLKNKNEKALYDTISGFLFNNSIQTGDKKLDEALNSMIGAVPEFLTVIGKEQHHTHQYSVDIHILKVLKEALKNEDYKSLDNIDKTILKYSILMHDLSKKTGIIDDGHQDASAEYANTIMEKLEVSPLIKERIYYMVKNHHWLKEFNLKEVSAENIAVRFRAGNDFDIAKIMAEADLKGVSVIFHQRYSPALSDKNLSGIRGAIHNINASGNIVISSKPIFEDKIPTQILDDKEYKVINIAQMDNNADPRDFGFHEIESVKDINLLVHMLNHRTLESDARTIMQMEKTKKKGALSTSIVTKEHTNTYCSRNYGFVLDSRNYDIATMSASNLSTGYEKDFETFVKIISSTGITSRLNYRYKFQSQATAMSNKIHSDDYAKLFKFMHNITHMSQIKDEKEYNFGNFTITGKDLRLILQETQDKILDKRVDSHNEIVAFGPCVSGIIAKENDISKIPQCLLDIAQEKNLPIYLVANH